MKRSRSNGKTTRATLAFFVGLVLARYLVGCASNDERLSERPWNTPKSWKPASPAA